MAPGPAGLLQSVKDVLDMATRLLVETYGSIHMNAADPVVEIHVQFQNLHELTVLFAPIPMLTAPYSSVLLQATKSDCVISTAGAAAVFQKA
jgi:hypothetical protein